MTRLPEEFLLRMRTLLPEAEYQAFLSTYQSAPVAGIRLNTLKVEPQSFAATLPFRVQPVPWINNGFYYSPAVDRPAKHPYYLAGLYYIQEPSAMTPAAILAPNPGDRVLDLCAAPGGKTTELGARLQGQGLLIANDLSAERCKALVRNLELFGVTNAVITNESPERLSGRFPAFFDKILVDAPCSGEGMFRKDEGAVAGWSRHSSDVCVALQGPILEQAARMLKAGGRMVYSTCTFSPQENEEIIDTFLGKHPEFTLLDIPKHHGFMAGIVQNVNSDLERTARLWPHKLHGEGHFVALLVKHDHDNQAIQTRTKAGRPDKLDIRTYRDFVTDNLAQFDLPGEFIAYKEHLYLAPPGLGRMDGLRVLRPGLYLGQLKKKHFAPSLALALALSRAQAVRSISWKAASEEVFRYLRCETLPNGTDSKGWLLICVDGYPLGWAKQTAQELKNYYPIAWRWQD